MEKKGQAAMEFLMTYGWAILVVIAAIAALAYFGVLDPARLLPDRCTSSAGMDCVDKANVESTQMDVALRNNVGFTINVTDLAVTGFSACTAELAAEGAAGTLTNLSQGAVSVANNEVIKLQVSGCSGVATGDRFDGVLTVEYLNTETGITNNVAVDIRGKVT